jgi:hypothetical protein
VAGTSDGGTYVTLKVKGSGGVDCGANPGADTGSEVLTPYFQAAGPYTDSRNWTFAAAGSYLLCAWLQDTHGSPMMTASRTITVRLPKLSLVISAPASVNPGQIFQMATTTQAEATRYLYVSAVADTGRGCPANAAAAQAAATRKIIDGVGVTGGPTTDTRDVMLSTAGQYLLCGYLQYQGPPYRRR